MNTPDRRAADRSRAPYPVGVDYPVGAERVALVDLLDRVLAGGVVIAGEITLAIADVDLVRISLRALVASVRSATRTVEGTATVRDEESP
ncbi:gas vesicle protein [Streptomyces sp. SP17BM10]|uniref:gas vesicle protein n=1 Tax=Streptomyces sp. SP17BM10 TaxID=3002530 RepID=UPI002E765BF3|nr:gas vesicle protein [Streptomyces sp. SP17BM10]MEE1787069.1 gas vesicle protein [Streptomyces sp. SP17BM10]